MKQTIVNYNSKIRNQLKTGDIVLFNGKGRISTGIKFATKSPWSHVGLIYVFEEQNMVAIWESTTLNKLKDIDTNTLRQGVQIVSFTERVEQYRGNMAIRILKNANLSKYDYNCLNKLRKELSGKPYEKSILELIKSAWDVPSISFSENQEDLSSLFCSELVAKAYKTLGLLPTEIPSNEFVPCDFSYNGKVDNLLKKAYLEEEIYITN